MGRLDARPCKSCGTPIIFAKSGPDSKYQPIELDPVLEDPTKANLAVRVVSGEWFYAVRHADVEKGETRGISHFATCGKANQHRKAR